MGFSTYFHDRQWREGMAQDKRNINATGPIAAAARVDLHQPEHDPDLLGDLLKSDPRVRHTTMLLTTEPTEPTPNAASGVNTFFLKETKPKSCFVGRSDGQQGGRLRQR